MSPLELSSFSFVLLVVDCSFKIVAIKFFFLRILNYLMNDVTVLVVGDVRLHFVFV